MTKIIAMAGKGGTGKTTTIVGVWGSSDESESSYDTENRLSYDDMTPVMSWAGE